MSINFFSRDIKFALKNKTAIKSWIKETIEQEQKSPGEINCIFCNDGYLLSLNKKYLKHNTLTDIITFDYSSDIKKSPVFPREGSLINSSRLISGDIFISIPRVKENAKKFNTPFETELSRVLVHGVMHLCGYGDKTKKEKQIMRKKEEEYLLLLNKSGH